MRRALVLAALVVLSAACGGLAGTSAPLPTVVLNVGGSSSGSPTAPAGQVTASGVVSSPQEAQLAFGQGGIVQSVHAAIGNSVRAGDVLVEQQSTAARLELDRAQRMVREMTSAAAIATADQALASAKQEQDKAQKKVNGLNYPRATEAFIDNLRAQITLARKELAESTRAFNHVKNLASNDPKRAPAELRMTQAQINLNKLVGNYNWYTGQPSEIDVDMAHADLDAANAAVEEAQWYAAALRGEPIPAEASGEKLSELQAAKDAVVAAQAQLDATRLTSPTDGTVGSVAIHPGEYATPGQTVVIVTDLADLRVETTDLSERDLPQVGVGQPVTVDVEALGVTIPGRVAAVAPVSETLGGDVVYRVIIALDEVPAGLRPGMSTKVSFGALPAAPG
jgi:multidrug resistance efflux pump